MCRFACARMTSRPHTYHGGEDLWLPLVVLEKFKRVAELAQEVIHVVCRADRRGSEPAAAQHGVIRTDSHRSFEKPKYFDRSMLPASLLAKLERNRCKAQGSRRALAALASQTRKMWPLRGLERARPSASWSPAGPGRIPRGLNEGGKVSGPRPRREMPTMSGQGSGLDQGKLT